MSKYIITILFAGWGMIAIAQAPVQKHVPPVPISKTPVANEETTRTNLFELDTLNANYYFRANLPGDNFLVIEFSKLSYWQGAGSLKEIIDAAKTAVQQMNATPGNSTVSKRVNVHLPIKNTPMMISAHEHRENDDVVAYNGNSKALLKLGMDTIRILKNYRELQHKKGKELVQVQYTFILKDLAQINQLADNNELINDIGKAFDAEVTTKKEKWHNPDMWNHSMSIVYDPQQNQQNKVIVADAPTGFKKGFNTDGYMGVALFQGELAAHIDIGYSYQWRSSADELFFIRVSASTLDMFDRTSSDVHVYGMFFVNGEIGTRLNKTNTLLPLYKTSVGVGYYIPGDYSPPWMNDKRLVHVFFNYSLSKAVTIAPEFYYMFPKSNFSLYGGMTVSLQLF